MNHKTMKDTPKQNRPYEKAWTHGVESLTDCELLALMIRSGTSQYNCLEIASKLLEGNQNNLLNLLTYSTEELQQFPGIGKILATQIKAVLELAFRISKTKYQHCLCMNSALSIADYYMEQLRHQKQEYVLAAFFDAKFHFLGDELLAMGDAVSCVFPTRILFEHAIRKNAEYMILLHNHPSGDPSPSAEDKKVTQKIQKGAGLLGLCLQDHIIIGDKCYFSFHENHLI